MKKLIFISFLMVALTVTACNSTSNQNNTADTTTAPTATVTYACPMHPEVVSNKPGKCPKCKMDLVDKTEITEDHSGHNH